MFRQFAVTKYRNDEHQALSIMWLNLERQENNGEEGQDLADNGVFFKYVRLGAVRLNVSTTGYKLVRLSEFPVGVDTPDLHFELNP